MKLETIEFNKYKRLLHARCNVLPSDLGGIAYYPIDDVGKWKTDLLGELQAAGFAVHTD